MERGLEFCIWCLKMFWKCDLFHALGKFLMVYFSCARLRWISVGSNGLLIQVGEGRKTIYVKCIYGD